MPNGINPNKYSDAKGEFNINSLPANIQEHVLKSINRAKKIGNIYDKMYIQYVIVPGIALRMANTDRKMSKGKLMMRKGMRHIE